MEPVINPAGADPDQTLPPQVAALYRLCPEMFRAQERYRIGAQVAKGGMGVILEAEEIATGRRVAMKVMPPGTSPEVLLARFVEEARVTAQLEHPNIVPVHEFGVDRENQVFYTMKFVEGTTLQEILDRLAASDRKTCEQYPLTQLLTIFQKICDAVSFAHSHGIIHRDLKPANIMVGRFGEVLLMDWGLAKRVRPDEKSYQPLVDTDTYSQPASSHTTSAGAIIGTPHYMAPEQAQAAHELADERTDIYALGAILYSLIAHRPPVTGATVEAVLASVRAGHLDPLPSADSTRYASLSAVMERAMSLDPSARYQTVTALQSEVTAYQAGFATQAEQAGLLKHLLLAIRRYRREVSIAAAAVLALFALAVFAFIHITTERNRADEALSNLREAAPLFVSHARTLAREGRFNEALKELDYAATLQPTNLIPILYKGDLLQSQWQLDKAAAAFQQALRLDPANEHAHTHWQICTNLLNSAPDSQRQALLRLLFAMSKEGRPTLELSGALRAYGVPAEIAPAFVNTAHGLTLAHTNISQSQLETLSGLPLVSLKLVNSPGLLDLSPLRDMPLTELDLIDCIGLANLDALRDLPLKFLNLSGCIAIANLEPLRASALEKLNLFHTEITDLSPLADLPLQILDLRQSKVADLTPITRMPLREIYLWQSQVKTPEQMVPITALSALEVLDASDTPLDDLNKIPRTHLRLLRIGGTRVKDLAPLAGSPIEILHADKLTNTFQANLDLSPLLECPRLRWVIVPRSGRNPEVLRHHPTIQRASYSFNNESHPTQTFTEFLNSLSPKNSL